jgi:hypothetical protein
MTESQRDFVLHLLHQGDWGHAVVAYQEEAGVDRDAALSAIQQLAREYGIERPRWRLAWWCAPAILAAALAIVFLRSW